MPTGAARSAVSAFVTRNHVMMVRHAVRDGRGRRRAAADAGRLHHRGDGLTWTLTLRDGLRFHDGTPVLARDAVASIRRWQNQRRVRPGAGGGHRRTFGAQRQADQFRLKHRFHLLPDALAHPTNTMAVIMPERLAKTPANVRLTEIVGSGPFRYLPAERVPGARNVYARFDGLCAAAAGHAQLLRRAADGVFRPGRMADHAGPGDTDRGADGRRGGLGRAAADGPGASLRAKSGLKTEVVETKGLIGFLRFNFLFPPFDNPAIRQAVLQAVNQSAFMQAVVGGNAAYDAQCGIFTPGTPLANDAGMEALSGSHSIAEAKRDARGRRLQGRTDRLPRAHGCAADQCDRRGRRRHAAQDRHERRRGLDRLGHDRCSARSAASHWTRAAGACSPRSPAG